MRIKKITLSYSREALGFSVFGGLDYEEYLMLEKDNVQLHFFLFPDLNPLENYGHVYIRSNAIKELYHLLLKIGL